MNVEIYFYISLCWQLPWLDEVILNLIWMVALVLIMQNTFFSDHLQIASKNKSEDEAAMI